MRRSLPLAFWMMTLATVSQGGAAIWSIMHGQNRSGVMVVSAFILLAITVAVFVKRPFVDGSA